MTAIRLEGTKRALEIREKAASRAAALKEIGITPRLAFVQTSDDPAGETYMRSLERSSGRTGIAFDIVEASGGISTASILAALEPLNADDTIHAILVQMPLPPGVEDVRIREGIDPEKDVDRVHPVHFGRVILGDERSLPCTARAAMTLVDAADFEVRGAECVVVGHSEIVGRPLALALIHRMGTVTVLNKETGDLAAHTRRADLLAIAVGKAGLIDAGMVKPGAVVIDIGINEVRDAAGNVRIVGDADPGVADVAAALSPVPGGVGPITTARMLENTVASAARFAPR